MKKSDAPAFGEFMQAEANRFGRAITIPEIETWFEHFKAKRVSLDDFKAAWAEHKTDPKHGVYFPNTVHIERRLRSSGAPSVQRDWRCAEEVGDQRCAYPGGSIVAGKGLCVAHYKIKGTAEYTDAASLQIIEQSREYVPPRNPMELMERGAAQRAVEGERWRNSHKSAYEGLVVNRRKADDAIAPRIPPKPDAEYEALERPLPELDFDAANTAAQLASQDAS